MKQYNTNQKKKIVEIINKVKNKKVQALKFNISIRTYYYWKKKLEETDSIENRSRKPKNSPRKLKNKKIINIKNKKIINKIVEIRKKYKYGKTKIKKFLEKENIKIGTTAIETILKEYNLYQKKKRKIRKKHKGKHAIYIKEAGEKVQIDVKYAFFGEIRYYQFTAVDIATNFLERMLEYFPFRVHCIQTDNGTEFTYRKLLFEKEHPLDIFCKKKHIKRVYSPVSSPWYNGVVESTHHCDQQEFYDFCNSELTLEKANQKLRKYNNFWNYKRIHSALNYDTPMLYFKKLRNT